MAVIPITTAEATFNALTRYYRPKAMVDNIFQDKPFWLKLRKQLKAVTGIAWKPAVQLAKMSGVWYPRAGSIGENLQQTFSPEIATTAEFMTKEHALPVLIPAQDVDKQGSVQTLVGLLRAYVDNAVLSARDDWSAAVFERNETTIGTGQLTDAMESLDQACYFGNTFGGINPLTVGQETWEAHVMVGATVSTKIKPVPPTWSNFEHLIDEMFDTCGESADLVLVTPETWQALKAQISANDYATAKMAHADSDVVKWGISALWVQDVPIVKDRDCYREAFVADQATTVLAKGHDAYVLNFKHMKLAYNQRRSFKWHEGGWKHTYLDYDAYLNMFYGWFTIGTDARRTLGRIINIDPTMTADEMEAIGLGTVRLPGAAA